MSFKPILSVPIQTIQAVGGSAPLDTGSTTVVSIPFTASGNKPMFIRIALTAGAAHVRLNRNATSATAVTGDTVITANEVLYLNCVGMNALAAVAATVPARIQISPLEEGQLSPPTVSSLA